MHKLTADAEAYCSELPALAGESPAEVVIFPSAPLLGTVSAALRGSSIAVGGQDIHPEATGAFTGDVSASQLVDAGCRWALCGHSERRRDHGVESWRQETRPVGLVARVGEVLQNQIDAQRLVHTHAGADVEREPPVGAAAGVEQCPRRRWVSADAQITLVLDPHRRWANAPFPR